MSQDLFFKFVFDQADEISDTSFLSDLQPLLHSDEAKEGVDSQISILGSLDLPAIFSFIEASTASPSFTSGRSRDSLLTALFESDSLHNPDEILL